MKNNIPPALRTYYTLGFHDNGESGDNVFGDCVFCGRAGKLWINKSTGEFRCWSTHCNKQGNTTTFVREIYHQLKEDSTAQKLAPWNTLSRIRGIPVFFLKESGIIFRGPDWLVPAFNIRGEVSSLYSFTIGGAKKVHVVKGMQSHLFGLEQLYDNDKSKTVAIAEGPWDAIMLRSKFRDSPRHSDYSVIGVPGAGIFKDEWILFFKGYRVIFCYDAGTAGQNGTDRAAAKLFGTARDLQRISWPDNIEKGYDVSNYFNDGGSLDDLLKLVVPLKVDITPSQKKPTLTLRSKNRPNFDTVLSVYEKYLKLEKQTKNGIRISFATVLSNLLPGDPVWLYLVGPSGSAKTEILRSFSSVSHCIFRSTISPNALISGFRGPDNKDPSLIPLLDGKTFIIKDMTVLLRKPPKDKDEIFSMLRDAYDGEISRHLGNGPAKEFKSKFSMLAGVTPAIYGEIHSELGERFVMYEIYNTRDYDDTAILETAASNTGEETTMREELSEIASRYLEVQIDRAEIPKIPDRFKSQIIALAQMTAMLRGRVQRDKFTERLLYRPSHEIGTRLVKQFIKLARGLALTYPYHAFTDTAYKLIKQIAIDTCIGFDMDVMRVLYAAKKPLTGREISNLANIPGQTLSEHLKDMLLLGSLDTVDAVDASTGRNEHYYVPSRKITKYVNNAYQKQIASTNYIEEIE